MKIKDRNDDGFKDHDKKLIDYQKEELKEFNNQFKLYSNHHNMYIRIY